jgi:hypothetical protein
MDNNLDILLTCYEEERAKLLQLIDNFIKDEEYQLAHFHQNALYQLNGRLRTLKNISDKFHDEKIYILRKISYLEERINTESSEALRNNYSKEILRSREEVERLVQLSNRDEASGDNLILSKALSDLLDKRIKGFNLILKKTDNLLLQFKYYNKILKLTIPFTKRNVKSNTLHGYPIEAFKRLGFEFKNNDSKMVLQLSGDKEKILTKTKIVLSKIVFEIFYFKEFQNESYIEIKGKPGRN